MKRSEVIITSDAFDYIALFFSTNMPKELNNSESGGKDLTSKS